MLLELNGVHAFYGKIEALSGMVVDLDADIIEIDVPYRQPRMAP